MIDELSGHPWTVLQRHLVDNILFQPILTLTHIRIGARRRVQASNTILISHQLVVSDRPPSRPKVDRHVRVQLHLLFTRDLLYRLSHKPVMNTDWKSSVTHFEWDTFLLLEGKWTKNRSFVSLTCVPKVSYRCSRITVISTIILGKS
jgi:hypothetical protein